MALDAGLETRSHFIAAQKHITWKEQKNLFMLFISTDVLTCVSLVFHWALCCHEDSYGHN